MTGTQADGKPAAWTGYTDGERKKIVEHLEAVLSSAIGEAEVVRLMQELEWAVLFAKSDGWRSARKPNRRTTVRDEMRKLRAASLELVAQLRSLSDQALFATFGSDASGVVDAISRRGSIFFKTPPIRERPWNPEPQPLAAWYLDARRRVDDLIAQLEAVVDAAAIERLKRVPNSDFPHGESRKTGLFFVAYHAGLAWCRITGRGFTRGANEERYLESVIGPTGLRGKRDVTGLENTIRTVQKAVNEASANMKFRGGCRGDPTTD